MTEETNETPETGKEGTTSDADGGDKPETPAPIVEANAAAKRMEDANIAQAKLLERAEALEARRALGGNTQAGQQPEEKKKDTDEEFAEKFDKGEVDLLAK